MTPSEGKTSIAPEVLLTIARLTTNGVPGVSRLSPVPSAMLQRLVKRGHYTDGVTIEIVDEHVNTDLFVVLTSDVNVRDVSRNIQRKVARAISDMVGMQVGRVNIHIEDIDFPQEVNT